MDLKPRLPIELWELVINYIYITDARSLIKLQHVDKLRWVLISKRLLRDITIKAYDYEFLKVSDDGDLPIHPKIRSLLNLILSPVVGSHFKSVPVWGFVKSLCIELTNTSLPLGVDVSYDWLQVLFYRMQEIQSLRLVGFTWNPFLIDLIKNSCTRKVSRLDLEILLLQDENDVDWNNLFQELLTNTSKTVDQLCLSSSSECINPMILLKLVELRLWKSLCIIWKGEMDSAIFQLLLSKLLLWINSNPDLELCKFDIFLPHMMENVTIPINSISKDRYSICVSVDPVTKKFCFLMVLKTIQNSKSLNIRRSLCVSSTSTLISNEECWTDENGSGIFSND